MGDKVEELAPRHSHSAVSESEAGDGAPTLPPLNPRLQGCVIGANSAYFRQVSVNRATPRSARALSRKLQDVLKQQQRLTSSTAKNPVAPEAITFRSTSESFQPRNWKQLSERELRKLTLVERSRYLAYEPEPKELTDKRRESRRRANITVASAKEGRKGRPLEQIVETEWDRGLVGYLKAADARLRLRSKRITYERSKLDEIRHLIASQPSSIEAVRLKCLLQPPLRLAEPQEFLAKHERERCEALLEDEKGLTINRRL